VFTIAPSSNNTFLCVCVFIIFQSNRFARLQNEFPKEHHLHLDVYIYIYSWVFIDRYFQRLHLLFTLPSHSTHILYLYSSLSLYSQLPKVVYFIPASASLFLSRFECLIPVFLRSCGRNYHLFPLAHTRISPPPPERFSVRERCPECYFLYRSSDFVELALPIYSQFYFFYIYQISAGVVSSLSISPSTSICCPYRQ